jgi:AcrR family transcriptional regulator
MARCTVSTSARAIVASARALFVRYGPAKTSVEEIAREAGVSKATVYNYFAGKEAIVAEVIEFERKLLIVRLEEAVEEADNPLEALRAFFRTRIREVQRHHKAYHAGRDDYLRHMPEVARAIERSRREERKIIEGVLKSGAAAGLFRPVDDVTLAADIIFTTIQGFTFPLFGRPVTRSAEKRLEELIGLFLTGICSDSARKSILTKERP